MGWKRVAVAVKQHGSFILTRRCECWGRAAQPRLSFHCCDGGCYML